MASTAEILEKEELSEPCIHLYREGIFWKAYQYSAFRVVRRQANLKLKKKWVKAVSREVVSLGFPDVTLQRIFDKSEIQTSGEKWLCIRDKAIDKEAYRQWFDAIPLMEQPDSPAPRPVPTAASNGESVLRKLREFRIEEATPMACMFFLTSLRKELIEYGNL